MLDPISSLSVAAAAVQFVDFCAKLVPKGNEIFLSTTGLGKEEERYQDVARALINHKYQLLRAMGPDSDDSMSSKDEAIPEMQPELSRLCDGCLDVAEELLSRLERLQDSKSNGKRWKSIRQALKSQWNKGDLDELNDTLSAYKGDLVLYILVYVK
jgi:hypothetical protein